MTDKDDGKTVKFELGGMLFEYDERKNEYNIRQHGISFRQAARVFFDYDRIELYDEENSHIEDRYDVIGDLSAGNLNTPRREETIGNISPFFGESSDIIFVVYTERVQAIDGEKNREIIRLISARLATNFERGLYYGKY